MLKNLNKQAYQFSFDSTSKKAIMMGNQCEQPCTGKILAVDDTDVNLQFLSILLKREGYEIQCATSGETALRSAQAAPPDLILLDITMPEMDGYEVCRRLKSNSTTAEIPVIFVSALDNSLTRNQAFAVGGMDYIAKPYRIQDILSSVEKALSKQPSFPI